MTTEDIQHTYSDNIVMSHLLYRPKESYAERSWELINMRVDISMLNLLISHHLAETEQK